MKQNWSAQKVHLGSAIVGGAVALFVGLAIGFNWPNFTNFLPYLGFKKPTANDWSSLDEVYTQLEENYDGDLDKDALIEGAKKGLVEAVGDTYTAYMTKEEAAEFNKSLHGDVGAGIGIELALREDYVRVTRTLPDNPARAAGILAGDIIYKVNGEEVWNLDAEEVAKKIRGPAGSKVTVIIVRDGEEKSFELTRETINNVSADVSYNGDTAIIMVKRFDTDTGTKVQELAKEFADKGIKKVILDLRGNGGGYVSAARDLLSLWLDGDKVLIQRAKYLDEEITYAKRSNAILKDMKTIVLVNSTTASASEIVAGALQDYNKATIIGEATYGKGVVQTLIDLSGGAQLKVTTAHWYTPLGATINLTGIKPDKTVGRTYDDINSGRDPQLDAALAE